MAKRKNGVPRIYVFSGLVGFLVGVLLANWCTSRFLSRCGLPDFCCTADLGQGDGSGQGDEPKVERQDEQTGKDRDNFVFVGIMTAKKFIDNRGLASHRTWASRINGKVMFFSSDGSVSKHGVPVVALPEVDDSYPPQKKSFMMLKYMHDHFIDKFEWFVRADDDVFIKGDKLDQFLRSINSSQPRFIGQAGVGKAEELGLLSLKATENFCMGGPGMIFSRETLRRIAPHIGYCLSNLYTTHEDVEIGRCVRQFAGIQCTWAYEMQQILYQNYKEDKGSFKETLKNKEVERAMTLHPVKDPIYQYRIFNYFRSVDIMKLWERQVELLREIAMVDQLEGHHTIEPGESERLSGSPGLNRFPAHKREEVISWEFFNKPIYSQFHNNPRRGMEGSVSGALDDAVEQVMELVNRNARQRGRTIDFKEILYGYRRVNPLVGADFILDLLLIYRKHKGRKMTVQVRRHAYLQQGFLGIQMREEDTVFVPKVSMGEHVLHLFQKVAGGKGWKGKLQDKHTETIHFIMPLAGRFKIFVRFMQNFEDVCLRRHEAAHLVVVLYHSKGDDSDHQRSVDLLQRYQRRYGASRIEIVHAQGAFSRGRGLELGAQRCGSDALLFFVDVDILWTVSALTRIRLNTKLGQQVYFPIVFSQYDPGPVCKEQGHHCHCSQSQGCIINPKDFQPSAGYWRQFGFGIATMYRADMLMVGGFDLSIEGWGKEDVDLYTKFLESNITVFRAVDPGMNHIFHEIVCDPSLEPAQLVMCINSKAQSYGDEALLATDVYKIPDIMKRHEKHALNVHR
ncbi:chondroitin sulfate synthase 1-like [Babylonia areolata]|uniref:chondroitin sulfate synthase 1-like n=1 Tax=Babylonia areolata TaxID=304850 RepID=UPI003FD21EC8